MNFTNVPGLKGIQTKLGAWTQLIAGFLLAVAELLQAVSACINGDTPLDVCIDSLPTLFMGIVVAANGLAQLGIGSKVEDVKATVTPAV